MIAASGYLFLNMSREATGVLLAMLNVLVGHVYKAIRQGGHDVERNFAAIPRDIRTVLSWFNLDPVLSTYVCCPSQACSSLYKPVEGQFPERCTAVVNGRLCKELLGKRCTVNGKIFVRPIRRFQYQSPIEWIARLLSRPGIEDAIETNLLNSTERQTVSDIWQTSYMRQFLWADGHSFWSSPKDEMRLLFSLTIDWFNAHHSPVGRKSWSIGAIYLVCQSLPLPIRFRPENMCLVGIIPGPKKTKGNAIDHFMKILVGDLATLWQPGVFFTRTYKFLTGRRVLAALGLVICDLDACRPLAGLRSAAYRYGCSVCWIERDRLSKRDCYDQRTWTFRDLASHLDLAGKWASGNQAEKDELWKKEGVRLAPLMELGYWNPFKWLVVEPMHNLFLGAFQRHCRHIWGMDFSVKGWTGSGSLPSPNVDTTSSRLGQLAYAKFLLRKRNLSASHLMKLYAPTLRALLGLCEGFMLDVSAMTKTQMVNGILAWVRSMMLAGASSN